MQNSMLMLTFSVLIENTFSGKQRRHNYYPFDVMEVDFEIGSCRQHTFLFCCGECTPGLLLCTDLKSFK